MASTLELLALSQIANSLIKNGNAAIGQVNITPSAANTPTLLTVTYGPINGSTFFGFVALVSTVPGTQVTGIGITSASSTGANIYVTRTNTTATIINYLVIGI